MSKLFQSPGKPKKAPKIHRTRLFKGRKTAKEVHAQFGMRRRCEMCGGPPVILIRTLATVADLKKRSPQYWAAICADAAKHRGVDEAGNIKVPTIPTTYGPMVRISSTAACSHHRKDLEVAAARGPDWILVEIDRGPGADNPIIQVVKS